ncbi:hypothetical protein PSACC_03280 [Paramicrosporidium saccamoebae]|uniref:GS catalytic domain-containing protein n=1 Tax=Paramicrosporidium saccamoebae TaxID=1246581 RepID=A0A2H9TGQ9_9FUNG|nr:hypothetical protein PSACC_03280 [Paramicrosporidium saccamoebae]
MDAVYSSTTLCRSIAAMNVNELKTLGSSHTAGYPDVIARVDLDSGRSLSLAPNHNLDNLKVYLMDFLDQDKNPLSFCPRSTLKSILKKLSSDHAISVSCGFELEWYNYKGQSSEMINSPGGVHDKTISRGMFGYSMLRPFCNPEYMSAILNHSKASGLEIDCFHTETGPGVYEVALKYKSALQAADECQLFKHIVKTTAYHHGMTASFMAKPWNGFPGCGGHIHVSLNDSNGKNVFSHMDTDGLPKLMKPFIAGILKCLPDLMPFMAPNINSYKRLDIRYWAPVLIGWGSDNRLAAVRVILCKNHPDTNRIEVRVPGADLNSYFALSAILAAGLYGIENDLSLGPELDSSALLSGDNLANVLKDKGYQSLPTTLLEATMRMSAPESMARKLFPSGLIEHFGMTRLHEIKTYEAHITDWERERYLELA